MATYFNIRVVKATNRKAAWSKLLREQFDTKNPNCDTMQSEKELKNVLFPNGFASWIETHHEIVKAITLNPEDAHNKVNDIEATKGTGGLYEYAEDLTNKFEKMYQGKEWDGEFFETIESFLDNEFNKID